MPLSESIRSEFFGNVYFVETNDQRYLKIGFTTQIEKRIGTLLGVKLPGEFELRLLGAIPGTRDTERWFHLTFAAARVNGEWFKQTRTIRTLLESLGFIKEAIVIEGLANNPLGRREENPIVGFIAARCITDKPESMVPLRVVAGFLSRVS